MDSRERTFLALNHEEPDRVPVDFWSSQGFKHKLELTLQMSYEEFLIFYDVDFRYIAGPTYIGPKLENYPADLWEDIWGVKRQNIILNTVNGSESYQEVVMSPLAYATTIEEINRYEHWPSPDWFDYSEIEVQCEKIRKQGRIAVFMGDRLNRIAQLKPAMYLRGVEQIFVDMALSPELAQAIFANISAFYSKYAERVFASAKGKLDILLMGDDFGSQNGPLISPNMWNDFLKEGFTDYIRIAKAHGLHVMHHSCGSVRLLIPQLIKCGLDVLQSLQPEAKDMNPWELKSEFGGYLSFHGGISIQKTLPFGTPEDVRKEVQDKIDALAPGGGYILCTSHNIQADTPVDNVLSLLKAYRDYGYYD